MSKILKIVTACLVLPVSFLCANAQEVQEEKQTKCCCLENSFGYLSLGVGSLPELVPSFGIGYRAQKDHHGFDLFGSIAKTWDQTTTRARVAYNYFLKPDLVSEFYVGLGLGFKALQAKTESFFKDSYKAFYTALIFGKQYRNEADCQRGVEVEIGFPTFALDKMTEKTWTFRKGSYSFSYPTSCKTSYVPDVTISYMISY